jgi:hypothetical protein
MSGGDQPDNVTQTQTTEPPEYLKPWLAAGAQEAGNLYFNRGPNQYYQGNTVTPFAGETEQALQMQTQRAQGGSDLTRGAQGYAQDVIGGNYLNSNPYIDAAFNQAAQATRGQLDSQFARSGRNIGGSQAARADQLNNLATQIYGGNYANERAMQNSVLGQANSLANQDYTDIAQLGQVGAQREELDTRRIQDQVARHDYEQNAPGIALDQYIARINNNPGGQTTSQVPVFQNRAAGGLGGASVGYGIGSNFGGWGGAIGAGLGGLLGAFG